jgi:hypothetical protein
MLYVLEAKKFPSQYFRKIFAVELFFADPEVPGSIPGAVKFSEATEFLFVELFVNSIY